MAASLIAEKGELPSGLTFFGSWIFIRCSDMGIA
jgi:hypothetical protein